MLFYGIAISKSKFHQLCIDTAPIHSNTIWCHCIELDDVSYSIKLTMLLQKLIVSTSITPISWTYLAACQQGVSKTLMEFISINLLLCLHNTPITFIQAKTPAACYTTHPNHGVVSQFSRPPTLKATIRSIKHNPWSRKWWRKLLQGYIVFCIELHKVIHNRPGIINKKRHASCITPAIINKDAGKSLIKLSKVVS